MKLLQPLLLLLIILNACTSTAQKSDHRKKIMAIVSHADDETFFSPVLSKYAKDHDVYLVMVTNGDMGVRDFANIPAGEALKKVRIKEAEAACKTLGIHSPIFLNYGDGKLSEWNNLFALDDDIRQLFRSYKPDIVITWGPEGGYGHADHRIVNSIVTEVFQKTPPSPESKLLYYGITQEIIDQTGDFKTQMGHFFKDNTHSTRFEFITHHIRVSEEDIKKGREAFGCHKSQFTSDEMDDIYQIVEKSTGIIYFRQWNGSHKLQTELF